MNALVTKKEVTSHFNRVASWYDVFQKMNPGYTDHLKLSKACLAAKPDSLLLDLCCGTGLSTEALRVVVRGMKTAKMTHLTVLIG